MAFIQSPYVSEIIAASAELAQTDWFEGNAGNISLLLNKEEVESWLECPLAPNPRVALENPVIELAGRFLLITASGVKIKHIARNPESTLALIEIVDSGEAWRLVWGLSGGGKPSSELSAHLLSHASRLQATGNSRALLHCHPPFSIAISFAIKSESREFSRMLWGWHAEGLAVFPDGVGVVELSLPGGNYLATQTANLLKEHRLVIWARHGAIACGDSLDECYTLIEVAEKIFRISQLAASCLQFDTYNTIAWNPLRNYWMADHQLESLAKHYKVNPKFKF